MSFWADLASARAFFSDNFSGDPGAKFSTGSFTGCGTVNIASVIFDECGVNVWCIVWCIVRQGRVPI